MEIELRSNWALFDDKQKAEWLCRFHLSCDIRPFDHNLIHDCIAKLKNNDLFVKNMLSEMAHIVYQNKSDAEIQTDAVRYQFYYSCFLLPIDAVGKCIYWTVRGEEV